MKYAFDESPSKTDLCHLLAFAYILNYARVSEIRRRRTKEMGD